MERYSRTVVNCCFGFEQAVADSRRTMKTCSWDCPSWQIRHRAAAH